MDQWDRVLPQFRITFNLLRRYKLDPNISAYEGIHGHTYDFINAPIAPFSTKVEILEDHNTRPSFGEHSVAGYYIYRTITITRQGYEVYVTHKWGYGRRTHWTGSL